MNSSELDFVFLDMRIGGSEDDIMLPRTWASSFVVLADTGKPNPQFSLDSSSGLGIYIPGELDEEGVAIRGGMWNRHRGIFSLNLAHKKEHQSSFVGFRCVYHPSP